MKPVVWQTEGHHLCPSWCRIIHNDDDGYEDRVHQGTMVPVTLTADELDHGEDEGMARPGAEGLPHVNMCLVQHYREEGPRIWVSKGGSRRGFYLTIADAEWLASGLGSLVSNDAESRHTVHERDGILEHEQDQHAEQQRTQRESAA